MQSRTIKSVANDLTPRSAGDSTPNHMAGVASSSNKKHWKRDGEHAVEMGIEIDMTAECPT